MNDEKKDLLNDLKIDRSSDNVSDGGSINKIIVLITILLVFGFLTSDNSFRDFISK